MDHREPAYDGTDLYETLQISPRADAEVIEAAYRVLARRYHPDLNPSPDATALMAQINVAWDLLRDPERRAAYDRSWAAGPAAANRAPAQRPTGQKKAAGTVLLVDPSQLTVGPLRQGSRRALTARVYTEPPGIRVEARITAGSSWLVVSPTVLQGLAQERVSVDVRAGRLRPGLHRGAIEFSTSWETRELPVEIEVRAAPPLFRAVAFVRHGPSSGGWRGNTVAAMFAGILLMTIVAALIVLAIGR